VTDVTTRFPGPARGLRVNHERRAHRSIERHVAARRAVGEEPRSHDQHPQIGASEGRDRAGCRTMTRCDVGAFSAVGLTSAPRASQPRTCSPVIAGDTFDQLEARRWWMGPLPTPMVPSPPPESRPSDHPLRTGVTGTTAVDRGGWVRPLAAGGGALGHAAEPVGPTPASDVDVEPCVTVWSWSGSAWASRVSMIGPTSLWCGWSARRNPRAPRQGDGAAPAGPVTASGRVARRVGSVETAPAGR
jgi:hypothetical protein